MGDEQGFKWSENEDCVVVKSVRAIAVYKNEEGDVVIRQEGDGMYDSEDQVIVLPANRAHDLVAAVQRELSGKSELQAASGFQTEVK